MKILSTLRSIYFTKYKLHRIQWLTHRGVHINVSKLPAPIRNHFVKDEYETEELKACIPMLGSNDVVLELGGGIGYLRCFCLKMLNVKRMISVEANPNTLQLLNEHCEKNGVACEVIHAAIHDHDGHAFLDTEDDFWAHSVIEFDTRSNKIKIPALTLDSIFAQYPLQFTTLLCDIEGAESFIDWSNLPKSINKIILEFHPEKIGSSNRSKILRDILNSGFLITNQIASVIAFAKE